MLALSRTYRMVAALLVALLAGGSLPLAQACAMGGDMQHPAEHAACCCPDAPDCSEHESAMAAHAETCCAIEADTPEPAPRPLAGPVPVPQVLVSVALTPLGADEPSPPRVSAPPEHEHPRPTHPLSLHVVHATFLN